MLENASPSSGTPGDRLARLPPVSVPAVTPEAPETAEAPKAGTGPLLTDWRLRQRDYLLKISRAMTARLDLAAVLDLVIRSAVTMTNGAAGAIALARPDGSLEVVASYRLDPRLSIRIEGLLGKGATSAWGGAGGVVDGPPPDTGAAPDGSHLLTLPLAMSGDRIGQIVILRSEGASVFTPLDSDLLGAFADQAAVAIQNAYLHERLVARERQLAAIVEHSSGGTVLADADGTVLAHNRAARGLAGSRTALVGTPLAQAVALVDEAGRKVSLELPKQAGDVVTVRGHVAKATAPAAEPPGRGRFVQVTVTALAGAGPGPNGYVADLTDLTAYKDAEDAKSAFLAGLSHDLKTPLALIRGYAETLAMESVRGDDELFDEAVGVILDESAHLTEMVDRMLQAAQVQSGALELDPDEVDAGALATRIVEEFRTASPDRQFHLTVAPGLPVLTADRSRLREALANLLDNAVRYSEPGSRIDVSVTAGDSRVRIAVRDHGMGIPPEHQERVFERFTRFSERGQGTGLGLFMARGIVAAHGGRITLQSEPGKGSTFTIELPAGPGSPTGRPE